MSKDKIRLYKVLRPNLQSPFQDFQFEIGKKYHCNDFDDRPSIECSRGFYATDVDGLLYAFNTTRKIFDAELNGKRVEINCFKRRYEYIKIIGEANMEDVIKKAKAIEDELGYRLSEVLNPINPLLIKPPKITDIEIGLLKQWNSVGNSVGNLVGNSVGNSVRDSMWNSVWDSVRDSVGDSVWDSVWGSVWNSVWGSVGDLEWDSVWDSVWDSMRGSVRGYMSSLFPKIKKWKYIEHEDGVNPFQPCVDLWHKGLVPSCDGKIWRLQGGKNAKVLFEISKEDLIRR